jgi:glycerol-3-phosphate acyltransferase PlsY
MIWGMVGLATMAAGVTLPVALLAGGSPLHLVVFGVAMAGFMIYTHRSNIARMRAGTEGRVKRLWLLRPRGTSR